jgi:hypothetical protein
VEAKFSDIKEAMEYIKANRENYKLRAGGSTAQPPKKSLRAGKTPTPPKPSPGPPKTLVEAKFSDIKEAMEYIKANRENYKLRAGGSTAQPEKQDQGLSED